jgi:hypothetical protein
MLAPLKPQTLAEPMLMPRTMDELRAEAMRLFPDDMPADRGRKVGLGSVGKYTPAELRAAHIKIFAGMMR